MRKLNIIIICSTLGVVGIVASGAILRAGASQLSDAPASHYRQFCEGFRGRLAGLPDVKVERHRIVDKAFDWGILIGMNEAIGDMRSSGLSAVLALSPDFPDEVFVMYRADK